MNVQKNYHMKKVGLFLVQFARFLAYQCAFSHFNAQAAQP